MFFWWSFAGPSCCLGFPLGFDCVAVVACAAVVGYVVCAAC